MCGIAGLWRFSGPDRGDGERIARMSRALGHRGPDDFGYLLANAGQGRAVLGQDTAAEFAPDVLLASRRLSIIDLTAAGRQPMSNETGDLFVAFNGAIHNYVELRSELRALGHAFRSRTDTEVVVHAYEEWGEDCARRFNGMWAYVIWDLRRRRLVCSRDRFGIKPLFVARRGEAFYVASEAKAILAGGEVPAVPNLAYVRRLLRDAVAFSGRETAFEGIGQVPAAHNLVVTRAGARESRYWSYTDRSETYDTGRPARTFRDLFDDSVRLRLRSDVPTALMLSGGLDSTAIAVRAKPSEPAGGLEAFTCSFPGYRLDERRYAELAATRRGMALNVVEYDPSRLLDDLSAAAWHMDLPPRNSQILARWQLLEAVGRKARVVLEGQGADEMLGGYPWRYVLPYLRSEGGRLRPWNLHRGPFRMLAALAGLDWRPFPRSVWERLAAARGARPGIVSRELDAAAERNGAAEGSGAAERRYMIFSENLDAALANDHGWRVLPYLLHYGDAISMAHSVESRVPFLDHRLVEFTFALPFDAKIRGAQSKLIQRRAFAEDLPPEIGARRDKIGFDTPLAAWLKPRFEDEIVPLLRSSRLRERGLIDPRGLEHCITRFADHGRGERLLFRCLAVEQWFRLFIDGEGFAKHARERPARGLNAQALGR